MTDPLPPKEDWSEVEAVERAFRERERAGSKAAILKAQALKILAIGASIALALIGLSFLRPDIFPKIWAPSQVAVVTKAPEDEVAKKGDRLIPDSSKDPSAVVEATVTTIPQDKPSAPQRKKLEAITPAPSEQVADPTSPSSSLPKEQPTTVPEQSPQAQPLPSPEPTPEPALPPAPPKQMTIVTNPEPTPSKHAPGSLAARLEQEIQSGYRAFTPKQFTETEEYKTAEYHGRLETIRDGKIIFSDGQVFNPLNPNYLTTTSEYNGDYAYCRQITPSENRYICRVLHMGVEVKI